MAAPKRLHWQLDRAYDREFAHDDDPGPFILKRIVWWLYDEPKAASRWIVFCGFLFQIVLIVNLARMIVEWLT